MVPTSSEFVLSGLRGKAKRPIALALQGLSLALLASMLAGALHDMSQAWDVAYYHMPFAGRLVGILPASEYLFSSANAARFQGFTLLGELLQGLMWRVTGRPESMNLVSWACVPLLAWFGARKLGVPWSLTVLSLLAIPLVHTHATSAYVDLPGNAALSVLVLLVILAYASGPTGTSVSVSAATVALAVFAAGVAANTKPMLQPIVAVCLVFLAVRVVRSGQARKLLPWLGLAAPVIFGTALKNLALHGNPYFPVNLTLLGHVLPGPEEAYSSSPAWLEHAPRLVRFVCSLLEVGLPPMEDPRRWTLDQWMPPSAAGYRMGGFFHAYVVAHVTVLVWRVATERSTRTLAAGMGFGLLTLVVSLLPQSHELRYYMGWMMVLVLLNLWLAAGAECPTRERDLGLLGGLATLALGVVLCVTRGAYAYPSGSSFAELLHRKVDESAIDGIATGERVCVDREPFDVLWAPAFHAERAYVLKEAEEEGDCEGFRRLP